MYKIILRALAGDVRAYDKDGNEVEVDLDTLGGVMCEDEFSEYFGGEQIPLIRKNVHNGYMFFTVEEGKLYTITMYDSDEMLTKEEEGILVEYTQGQWSDGIGEGFEQDPCAYTVHDEEVFISPWGVGQQVEVIQKEA